MAGPFYPEGNILPCTDNGNNSEFVPNCLGNVIIDLTNNANLASNLQVAPKNQAISFDEISDVNITPRCIDKVEKRTWTDNSQGDEDEEIFDSHSDGEMCTLIPTTVEEMEKEEHNPDIGNEDPELPTNSSPHASQSHHTDDVVWHKKARDSGYGSSNTPLNPELPTNSSPHASQSHHTDDVVWHKKDSGYGSSNTPLSTEEFVFAEECNTEDTLAATFTARLSRDTKTLKIWPMIIKKADEMAGLRKYEIVNKGRPIKAFGTGFWNLTIEEIGFSLNIRYPK